MITVQVLEADDILQPNDLVRDCHEPGRYYQCSDDYERDTAIYYGRASWRLRAWIGKTLGDLRSSQSNGYHKIEYQLQVIRLPINHYNGKEMLPPGFIIEEEPEWLKHIGPYKGSTDV